VVQAAVIPATPDTSPPVIPSTSINVSALNEKVRESVVNILCTITNGPQVSALTGSGVIIDSRGVILTNAHIGQYFLLKDVYGQGSLDCVIRTGNPAREMYHGELLYLSTQWLKENQNEITSEKPMGTGENDFALILITKNANGTPFSGAITALNIDVSDIKIEDAGTETEVLVGYPAGFLGATSISRDLDLVSAVSTIKQIFTFKETTIDLISLGGSVVAQRGSSGGAVVSTDTGKLIGIFVTTSEGATTGERDLRAITLSHINRGFKLETGTDILDYIAGDLNFRLIQFQNILFPTLSTALKSALTKTN